MVIWWYLSCPSSQSGLFVATSSVFVCAACVLYDSIKSTAFLLWVVDAQTVTAVASLSSEKNPSGCIIRWPHVFILTHVSVSVSNSTVWRDCLWLMNVSNCVIWLLLSFCHLQFGFNIFSQGFFFYTSGLFTHRIYFSFLVSTVFLLLKNMC